MEFQRPPFNAAPLPDNGRANFSLDSLNTSMLYKDTVVDTGQFTNHQLFSVRIFKKFNGFEAT